MDKATAIGGLVLIVAGCWLLGGPGCAAIVAGALLLVDRAATEAVKARRQ